MSAATVSGRFATYSNPRIMPRVEALASPALVPVDRHERILELRVEALASPPHPLRFPRPKRRFFRHGSIMPSEIQRIGAGTPDALPEPDSETSARKGRP